MPLQVHYHKPRPSVLVSPEVAFSNHQYNLLLTFWQEPRCTPQLLQLEFERLQIKRSILYGVTLF